MTDHDTDRQERVATGRLWRVGLVAFAASSVASLLVLFLAVQLLSLPADFPPFQPMPVVASVAVGVLGAVLVLAALSWFSRRPITLFRIVAVAALLLSFVPNALFLGQADSAPFPGISIGTMGTLSLLHVVTAAITVSMLTTWAREK